MKQDIFAVKLCELARQFERMQRRLRLCQTEDHPRIRQEMTRLLKEYRETDQLLSRRAAASRSSAAAALSAAQQAYCREAEKILEQAAPHAQPGRRDGRRGHGPLRRVRHGFCRAGHAAHPAGGADRH